MAHMETTVQVREGGTVVLPADVRERYHIEPGDMLRLLLLDDALILTPAVLEVPELAREIEQARVDAGLSMDELLAALRRLRQQILDERSNAAQP